MLEFFITISFKKIQYMQMWFICLNLYLKLHRQGFEAEITVSERLSLVNLTRFDALEFGFTEVQDTQVQKMFFVQKKETKYFTSSAKEFA